MNKIIIFDFNRTLYDPEAERLMYGVRPLLRRLRTMRFTVILVTTVQPSRIQRIRHLGLFDLCEEVVTVSHKSARPFRRLIITYQADVSRSFVVGDRVRQEIRLGNRCGLQTIWLKRGRFRLEEPQSGEEIPQFTIRDLRQLLPILASCC